MIHIIINQNLKNIIMYIFAYIANRPNRASYLSGTLHLAFANWNAGFMCREFFSPFGSHQPLAICGYMLWKVLNETGFVKGNRSRFAY